MIKHPGYYMAWVFVFKWQKNVGKADNNADNNLGRTDIF